MTTIAAGSQVLTVITTYTVAPERQQELVDLLVRAARTVKNQSGFISFNVHKSLDKTHVVSYTQWESHQAFDEALQDASVIPFVQAILKLATFEPHLYEVAAVIHRE